MTASRAWLSGSSSRLYTRLCQARHTPSKRFSTQVEPPREREAARVERQVDGKSELRAAGKGDRLAKSAGDQIPATCSDRADESERGTCLDAGSLESRSAACFTPSPHLAQVLLAEDRGDHPIGRAVADARGDEEDKEHC